MYQKFFGLTSKPFSLLPDTSFLYLGDTHRLALDLLEYGVAEQTGFVVVTGEIGSGKTMLIRQLLKTVPDNIVLGVMNNTRPSLGNLMRWVMAAFDLPYRDKDPLELYDDFISFLVLHCAAGRRVALVIDEAQNLDRTTLEELRLLSNINSENDFLFQMIFVGQPELLETLKDASLKQFVQRIGVHFHLEPLSLGETLRYIRHRLGTAGGDPELFDEPACAAVYYFTEGIPRLINIIADLSLVVSYAHGRRQVGIDAVIGVAMQRNRGGLATFNTAATNADEARRAILSLCTDCPPSPEVSEISRRRRQL